MGVKKAGPVVTDNGNFVIDVPFDAPEHMADPAKTLQTLKLITGVVEVGLFCGLSKPVAAFFGNADGSVSVRKEGEEAYIIPAAN